MRNFWVILVKKPQEGFLDGLRFSERRKNICSSFFTQKFYIKSFFQMQSYTTVVLLKFNVSKLHTSKAALFTKLNKSFLIRTILKHGPGSKKLYPQQ